MSCDCGVVLIPRIACRVVCGLLEVMATLLPTSAFVRVDLPALGRPTTQAKPDLCGVPISSLLICCSRVCCVFSVRTAT